MRRVCFKQPLAMFLLLVCLCGFSLPALGEGTAVPSPTAQPTAEPKEIIYPGLSMEAQLGYDGLATYLRTLPVRVALENTGGDINGVLAVDIYRNEVQYDRYELPVQVASGAKVIVDIPVELTMKQARYKLQLLVDGVCLATCPIAYDRMISPETMLVGVLSDNPQGLAYFSISSTKDPLRRNEKWQPVSLSVENFPRNTKMMDAFAFLVVDGVDAGALDAEQQQVLDHWLQKGGIIFVGGGAEAAVSYPFFEKYTGISAGKVTKDEDDITEALLAYVKAVENPLGEGVTLTQMDGAQNVLVQMEQPLLDRQAVGDGYVVTAAFSISGRPMNSWLGTTVFWQRFLIMAVGERYQQIAKKQQDYYSRENDYIDSSLMNAINIPNDKSFILPLVLLLVFVALVGFGSYYLLLKKDKREWMWVTIPGLSICFSLLLLLASNWTTFKQPVAVLSAVYTQGEDGVLTEKVRVSAAIPDQKPMTVSTNDGTVRVVGNLSNYYDVSMTDGATPSQPNQLRYTYRQGETSSITFPAMAPWGINSFFIEGENPPRIDVDGTCWWEEDGLHIQLINRGEHALGEGYVVTMSGYCSVGALLPGKTEEYVIAYPAKAKTTASVSSTRIVYNGNDNVPIVDGRLLTKAQQDAANLYSITSAMVYPEMWTDSKDRVPQLPSDEIARRIPLEGILNDCINRWDWYGKGNVFHYITFDNDMNTMTLLLNGQPAKRTAQQNVVDVQLVYQPVSKTGLVRYDKGQIPVYEADLSGASPVKAGRITELYQYFRFSQQPAFCFVWPEEAKEITVSDISIESIYSYGDYSMHLYDFKEAAWVEVSITQPMVKQFDADRFMNRQGEIFVQYLPGTNTDAYAEMSTPQMTLEGREK